jgi:hypothetical protein
MRGRVHYGPIVDAKVKILLFIIKRTGEIF